MCCVSCRGRSPKYGSSRRSPEGHSVSKLTTLTTNIDAGPGMEIPILAHRPDIGEPANARLHPKENPVVNCLVLYGRSLHNSRPQCVAEPPTTATQGRAVPTGGGAPGSKFSCPAEASERKTIRGHAFGPTSWSSRQIPFSTRRISCPG